MNGPSFVLFCFVCFQMSGKKKKEEQEQEQEQEAAAATAGRD